MAALIGLSNRASQASIARWQRLTVMLRQLDALARAASTLEARPASAVVQWHRDANALTEWMNREITRATVESLAADRPRGPQ